jgi:serine/threonine protein phosphatase PrpC
MNKEEENKVRNNSSNNKIIFNSDLSNTSRNKNFLKIPKNFKFHNISRNNLNLESKTVFRNHNMTPSSSTRIINPILGFKKMSTHTLIKNSSLSNFKKIIANSPNHNSNEREEKLNLLNSIFKTKGNDTTLNFTGAFPLKKVVQLSSEIFRNNYKNFTESIISKNEDIFNNDIIKGFAYNSSIGNIRSYNEDEIAISKLFFNSNNSKRYKFDNDNQNFCHFFAIYDGHGGKGCSTFLKENLHKYITEFSFVGMKIGIDLAEEKFLTKKAVDEKGKIIDPSGSCGIMLMIQGKKCIIANVGDSRLVIFKNKLISFTTTDHKPDSIIEKARIELSGGKLYKIQTLIPIYHNGERVNAPWRVNPGQLSVSRTFGDIQAKEEKFGGNKTAIIALPDITEIELDNDYNFIVMASDGIFDVLKNEELLECIQIVIKEKKITNFKNDNIHQLCGDFAAMIIKSALAKDSFDNISCIVIAINLDSLLI